MPMIEIRDLVKAFGPREVLSGISLDIAVSEHVLLVGPNGAGKTTLLRILATLSRPTSGEVRINGQLLFEPGTEIRKAIGFLSHNTLLYGDLTARQNLQFYARMYAVPDATSRIRRLLEDVDLVDRQEDLVRTFSRGMQQRLAIARVFLHCPRLLLLDEPYTGLDWAAAETLTRLLIGFLGDGSTLILTTHHPADEGRLADRVIVLDGGRITKDIALAESDASGSRSHPVIALLSGGKAE